MRVPRGFTRRTALRVPRGNLANLLKPLLRRALRPIAGRLYEAGVTANQVTSTSLIGSVLVGAILCRFADYFSSFAMLPAWLVARTAFAAVDGTLAIEFGQKSRVGGVLNEVGDVVSDIALFSPLAFVPPFSGASIALVVCFAAMSEFVGVAGTMLSGTRRLEGPLGKVDRSIVLALVAIAIAACGRLPEGAWLVVPALCLGLVITIWNRLRFALVERGTQTW
ncbi:CDP-alcohol phosphatidyltransferase family protein [Bradyrhizobium erythrophlei]|uniref:CDP-diacylglycerol--glycerol-3-phosphate 3-phosphatidyltransferase n=1 Tax=Bradyrhizobium erythrophlei TaxID=1437360 RepID=A0A1M5PLG0_9BRAD|nr:CDP-alcohol phosphatidyltransferase family protein [Bradyrhizobium erythrophlei]SHH02581.1 CDP-diacylglycerol--glycerol-3-phosphate 3-phosphatidyltransferase [Bradyrhizobium erythrophlei]